LQMESAWILTNVAASDDTKHTKMVVDLGVIPTLTAIVKSPSMMGKLRHTCLEVISNIAGDSAKYRDILLDMGYINEILRLDKERNRSRCNCDFIWMLRSFCGRTMSPPKWEHIKDIVPIMVNVAFDNKAVERDIINALAALDDLSFTYEEEIVKQVTNDKKVTEFIKLMDHKNAHIQYHATATWANLLATKDNTFVEMVIKSCDVLNILTKKLSTVSTSTEPALLCLSNIAATSSKHLQTVIDCKGLLPSVITVCGDEKYHPKIRKEAIMVLLNACLSADDHQIEALMLYGAAFVLNTYAVKFGADSKETADVLDTLQVLRRMKALALKMIDHKG